MRKRLINVANQAHDDTDEWLDLHGLAQVEITSEDPASPIEGALATEGGINPGWRAAAPGKQIIRLLFDRPRDLRRILLRFEEHVRERTHEFALRWSTDGRVFHDLRRQQWNFSPESGTTHLEVFEVDLKGVSILELTITPDISGGDAIASLSAMRLA